MIRLRIGWLYRLYFILICCILGSSDVLVATDKMEGGSMADIMEEFKSQVDQIFWMSSRSNWKIIAYKDSWLKGRHVFCCIDQCGNSVILAKDEERWIRLSGGGDFSGMNKLLKDYKIAKSKLNEDKALINFLEVIYKLYQFPAGFVLSKDFLKREENLAEWLNLDRDLENLKALCSGPETTIKDDFIKIEFNILTGMGSVERWSLYCRYLDDHISVEQLTIRVLKPIGTYLYLIIG